MYEILALAVVLSSLTSSNLLFDSEWVDEDSWQTFEGDFSEEIKTFKPANRTLMCGLTFDTPYYDCSNIWTIWMVYGETDEVLCNFGAVGCAYFRPYTIFLEEENFVDVCGRSSLHHELLHLKYYDAFDVDIVHDFEECIMW